MTTPLSIFFIFLRLGCLAFGGPTAHLGYFHAAFVEKRRWIDEDDFADLIALCQFLPGPASSQVGLSIGLLRGGRVGALAAWAGFTLPSALIMTALALGLTRYGGHVPEGLLTGLKVVAVAVVAKALWLMGRKLCPDAPRLILAGLAAVIILGGAGYLPALGLQLVVIILGAIAGLSFFTAAPKASSAARAVPSGRGALILFASILAGLPLFAVMFPSQTMQLLDIFYRTGAMVFGGGHVVLPVLEAQTVPSGLMDADNFLAGYGAAQALPGPLFAFSAFLGGSMGGLPGAVLALLAIYLPSFLLVFGVMPVWQSVSARAGMRAALMGVNAAVAGLLLAALWDPMIVRAITGWPEAGLAAVAFAGLMWGRVPPWAAVFACALLGVFAF